MSSKIPSPPFSYASANNNFLDLTELNTLITQNDTNRQGAYDLSSKIKSALVHARASFERNLPRDEREVLQTTLEVLIQQALQLQADGSDGKPTQTRLANLGFTFGDYVQHKAYAHFLQTGTLIPQSVLPSSLADEEYLSGIISLNQDVARYAIGRATERDVKSVLLARDLVSSVLDHLMKYDFRNGNLRRKYDGVKYALKTCETVLYELSVTGCDVETNGEPSSKRTKLDDNNEIELGVLLPQEELESLRQRMVHRDDLRETLIKKCRDGQKAAKQAIYALHRDDFKAAAKLIKDCETCVLEQLNPIVEEEPSLRHGSFANVLEEYAEAKLFYAWLVDDGSDIDLDKPSGKILIPSDFTTIPLVPEEYLGGLCDLTGEVGRYAVKRGTLRDTDNVKLSLETNMSIQYALESLQKLPGGGISKKMDPLRHSVQKLEKMLYELSLVKATGRNIVAGINEIELSNNE